jgi:hypothetical protein
VESGHRQLDRPCPLGGHEKTHVLQQGERENPTRRANQQPSPGKLPRLSSPLEKNISLNPSGKSFLQLAPSCPERGALRNVINAGGDAVDVGALTRRTVQPADGEVVWS